MNQNQSRTRGPVIVAFLLGGGLLLALGLFADRLRSDGEEAVPELTVLSPAPGDSLTGPLLVRFRTDAPLALERDGWMAGSLHPHILLDGREIMAAAADIRVSGDAFVWTLPALPPGPHRLLLTWAGSHHGVLGDTTGRAVSFRSY